MALIVLRKGPAWTIPSEEGQVSHLPLASRGGWSAFKQKAKARFTEIADAHCSRAVWLTECGYLISDFPIEEKLDYPYEQWRDQALHEASRTSSDEPSPFVTPNN